MAENKFGFFPSTQSGELVSLQYGKYDDVRMPWVGRYPRPRTFAITDVAVDIAERNENRVWITIQNIDADNEVWLNFGEDAAADLNFRLPALGATFILDRLWPWPDRISAVCSAGETATIIVNEVSQIVKSGRGE